MRLPRNPHLMTDDELAGWARDLIARRAPESDALDYKRTIKVDSRSDRVEVAKDITSFANEHGGVLLYGVPEEEEHGVPVPRPLAECGLDDPSGLPAKVENILVDIVEPPLPELFIKTIQLSEIAPKVLILAHHPASWNRPHRVEYKDARYYRRANYRAVIMTEREVEAAYASRRSFATAVREFVASTDFGEIAPETRALRAVIVPRFSLVRREIMGENAFRNWLEQNTPRDRRGQWVPFLEGVRFNQYASGAIGGQEFELRLFHSGATSFTRGIDGIEGDVIDLSRIREIMVDYVLHYADAAFEHLRLTGPISIHVSLHNVKNLRARYFGRRWTSEGYEASVVLARNQISFSEDSSVSELARDMSAVAERIMERVAAAFGRWPEAR